MQAERIDISIIIVNYRTPDLTSACIDSVYRFSEGFSFEIIVADNHSQDHSKETITSRFPLVKWIDMGHNAGFAKANNRAIRASEGDYILLLNSDTELYENCIQKTLAHYKSLEKTNKVGFVGCKIQNRDFSLQPSCNYYFPGLKELLQENALVILFWVRLLKKTILRKIDKYERLHRNHEVVWLGVPFAMLTAEVKRQKDMLFDEDFFMYSEDKEWNYRLARNGYRHFFFAETGIFHVNGGSSGFREKRQRQIIVSKWLYLLKAKGYIYYGCYIALLCGNLLLDAFLYQVGRLRNKTDSLSDSLSEQRKFTWKLIVGYAFSIPVKYGRKYSSSSVALNTYIDP